MEEYGVCNFKLSPFTTSSCTPAQFLLIDVKWGSKLQQSTDYDKNTLLHSAARHGNIAAVRVLLQLNFDTYIENCDGKLPIHLAAEEGHFRLVVQA